MTTTPDEVMLPADLLAKLRAKVDGERFKSEADVIHEGLIALEQREESLEDWLRKIVVPSAGEIEKHPERALTFEDVQASLDRHHREHESAVNWRRTVFLHTGWTAHYDGSEAPEGGHAYLKQAVGVEAENFKPVEGWCYGYAPVSRTSDGRKSDVIPKANRTINIEKLGASKSDRHVDGITVVWTARHPVRGPVIVGLYDNATIFRFMPGLTDDVRPFIAKAQVENCHLIPESERTFEIVQKQKGFPGMAAAWFPGIHADGPAKNMLDNIADYLPRIRRLSNRSG